MKEHKQTFYMPEEMLKELREEARLQDRSISWIIKKSWEFAREDIKKYRDVTNSCLSEN